MEMRCVLWSIAGRPDVADEITATQLLAFMESRGIRIEMSVVVTVLFIGVELIDSQSSRLAIEQFSYNAVVGSNDDRAARGQDIDRLVAAIAAARFIEHVVQCGSFDAGHGDDERAYRRRLIRVGWHCRSYCLHRDNGRGRVKDRKRLRHLRWQRYRNHGRWRAYGDWILTRARSKPGQP
jgi:hypothetical protein